MASISEYTSKTGQITFKVRYRYADRSAGSCTFPTRAQAEKFGHLVDALGAEGALKAIGQPVFTQRHAATGPTVADAVEKFIALRPNPSTRELYRRRARVGILPALGDIRVGELTHERVQLWANETGRSSATVSAWLAILGGALRLAVERGDIRTNPAAKIRIPRTRRKKASVFLSRDEFELVVKSVSPHYRPLVEFLAATGCRFGEAAALTPADVDLQAGTVRFGATYSRTDDGRYQLGTTKTQESERTIRVPQRVLEMLDLSGEHVFMTTDRTPVQGDGFRTNIWSPAMKRTGLPLHRQPRIHDIRHTHASWLMAAGVSLPAISKRLGHRDLTITLRTYGHAATDAEDTILAALA